MADNSLKKGRYTKYSNKIGLFSNSKGSFIKNDTDVVLNFPFKDTVLEAGMSKEDKGREERFLHLEIDSKDIDTLEEPKVLTDFRYIDENGETSLTASNDVQFFDEEGGLKQNLLIKGNNLLALHTIKVHLAGKVKLIYIDPPFNTGNDSFKYNDKFNHSAWLTFMRNRLEVARELLADDGSIFVHTDHNESHYVKVLMDEIFGQDNFVDEIVWSYGTASGGRAAGAKPVNIHDYIVQFAKNYDQRQTFKQYTPYSQKYLDDWFKFTDDDGRRYRRRMRGRDENGDTVWTKQYLDESPGVPLTTVWTDIKQVYADPRAYKAGMEHTTEIVKGFDGQKPEALIERIIKLTTNEGDLVLDYHLGTGTTSAVAHKMNRRWIGIEQMDYIEDSKARLKGVIDGDQTGISKDVSWKGGGSFVYFELKKYNQEYVERIMEATSLKELEDIYVDMRNNAFLKFWFDRSHFEKDEDFRQLDLDGRKNALADVLDENQLYLNYADMNDTRHNVTADEKALTDKFYGEN